LLFARLEVPPGYERRDIHGSTLIARQDLAEALAGAMRERIELIAFARRVPGAREMQGRQTAYAITVSGTRVVVRRNHHGGALRKLTADIFVWPTAAPRDLAISIALRRMSILTPPVVAIAMHRVEAIFAAAEVVTEEIVGGQDFGAFLLSTLPGSDDRRKGWNAVEGLLAQLGRAGVRHHDLNVKNLLLRRNGDDLFDAYLLDVDRVKMNLTQREADAGNRGRLRRSIVKWRDTRGAKVSDAEID